MKKLDFKLTNINETLKTPSLWAKKRATVFPDNNINFQAYINFTALTLIFTPKFTIGLIFGGCLIDI